MQLWAEACHQAPRPCHTGPFHAGRRVCFRERSDLGGGAECQGADLGFPEDS